MDLVLRAGPDNDGAYFLDRDGTLFHHVLNYLRDGAHKFVPPDDIMEKRELAREAEALGIIGLVDFIKNDYKGAPIPSNEEARATTVQKTQLGTGQERLYDDITRVVAALTAFDKVAITVISRSGQWTKSQAGPGSKSGSLDAVPRNQSVCSFMLAEEDPKEASMLVIKDMREDERTCLHPLALCVNDWHVAYAGAPLVSWTGHKLGAFCLLDRTPREPSHAESQLICNFANLVVQEMERSILLQLPQVSLPDMAAFQDSADAPDFSAGDLRKERMREALDEIVVLLQVEENLAESIILWSNQTWTTVTGSQVQPPAKWPGKTEVTFQWDDAEVDAMKATQRQRSLRLGDWLTMDESMLESIGKDLRNALASDEPWECCVPTAKLLAKKRGVVTSSRAPVVCRFVPVDLPLDVNATVVRPVPEKRDGRAGEPLGSCAFLTMMLIEDGEVLAPSKSDRYINSSPTSSSTRTQATLESVLPFKDVRVMSLLEDGEFGKTFYGLLMGCPVMMKLQEHPHRKASTVTERLHLQHPNLVQTFRFLQKDKFDGWGSPDESVLETWMVQEWCELGTLEKVCLTSRTDTSGYQEALAIVSDIARAGKYLHQNDIIHGDMLPRNVFLKRQLSRRGFVCKLCATGLGKSLDEQATSASMRSCIAHLPPEVFKSNGQITKKADIYALGIILWELVKGEHPFSDQPMQQVVQAVAAGMTPQLPGETPGEIRMLHDRCTRNNPHERPSFEELVKALAKAKSGLGL